MKIKLIKLQKKHFEKKIIFWLVLSALIMPIFLFPAPVSALREGCSVIATNFCGKDILTGQSNGYSPSMDYNDCGRTSPLDSTAIVCCCPGTYQVNEEGQVYREGASAQKTPKFTVPEFQIPINTIKLSEPKCVADASGNFQCAVPWLGEYITGLYDYGLSIAGILAAIILMAGGVLWIVSEGDASRITQAKELILGSIVGLIILAGSYVLLFQINPNLTTFQPLSIGSIKNMDTEPVSSEGNLNNSKDCLNCKVLSSPIPYKDGSMLNTALDAKLLTAYNNSAGLTWRVTEAYPPTVKHNSACHYNGACVDIALTGEKSCANVAKLITTLQNAGLSVLNEYTDCKGTKTTYSTAGHLHVR